MDWWEARQTREDGTTRAAEAGIAGYAQTERGSGYVVFHAEDGAALDAALPWESLIFARQKLPVIAELRGLPASDRIQRRLVFKSRAFDNPTAAANLMTDTLTLESQPNGACVLTRIVTHSNGLAATLVASGADAGSLLQAVEAVNAPPEFMAGKQLIAKRTPVSADKLADTSVSMKEVAA